MKDNSKHITIKFAASLLVDRDPNAHKYTYGHALLVCGSYNMPGAALLATGGALRSGCGLVTTHACKGVRTALIANYPSAILDSEASDVFSTLPAGLERYDVVGFGCGLGQNEQTIRAVEQLLTSCKTLDIPLVIDADGLNVLANHKEWLNLLPPDSIMTPHLGELKRLVGEWQNEEEMLNLVADLARRTKSVIVVKGPSSRIVTPDGDVYVNTTGNAGMAKGGSGDVLTGLITGLRARGYNSLNAAILGVWIHGFAGDKASDCLGQEAMNSADLIDFLADGFMELE